MHWAEAKIGAREKDKTKIRNAHAQFRSSIHSAIPHSGYPTIVRKHLTFVHDNQSISNEK